jgi:AmmeMemoRadiSam system protein B
MTAMTALDVRPSALAGAWYSNQAEVLAKDVDSYMEQAELPPLEGEIVGLLVPHAGHRYSGPVAGHAYKTIQGKSYDSVVVLSPYHHSHYQPILTTGHDAYQTPLGNIPIDKDNLIQLEKQMAAEMDQQPAQLRKDHEHAVEIELPFLQRALVGEFALLPLMLSAYDPAAALMLGRTLAEVLAGQNVLLVASTDLSHFYPERTANSLDQNMLDAIESFEPSKVIEVQSCGKGQACGIMAVLAAMEAAQALGAQRMKILAYATSGKTSGDYDRVVGYGAGVFLK